MKICPGSNRWAPASIPGEGRGRCSVCKRLVLRNLQGILFTHKRIEET